jgi:hypothetical protein
MRVRNSRLPVVLLTLAVSLMSARMASAERAPHAASWVAVERLRPGQPISITFKDGTEAKGWVIKADDGSLYYFRAIPSKLPGNVRTTMDETRDDWPKLVDGAAIASKDTTVRLSIAGIYDGARKVVDCVVVPRADIRAIRDVDTNAVGPIVAGVLGGLLLGAWIDNHVVDPGPGGGTALIIFGIPVAGGVGAYYATRARTFYRAPPDGPAPVDAAMMRRIIARVHLSAPGQTARNEE